MQNIFKALRVLSMAGGLVMLFYVYASMPARVGLTVDTSGAPETFIPKSTFFYLSLVLLVASNLIYVLLREYITSSLALEYEKQQRVSIWANGIVVFLNLFFIASFTFIFSFNSPERLPVNIFGNIVYVSLGMLLIWLAGAFYAFSAKSAGTS